MEFKDYYATLGVPKTATDKEMKQAYRKLARKFHPDVNPGDKKAESRFKEVNEAYEVLGDASKRAKYDELGANWKYYEQTQRAGGAPFEGVMGGQGGYRTVTADDMQDLFGGEDPFSDFFKQFFGGATGEPLRRGRGGRRGARTRRAADIEQQVELSLEEAFAGTTRRLSVRQDAHAKTIEVRIPPGVKDGSRVRVAGEGTPGEPTEPPGDLYLKIRVRPHSVFTRDGTDLHARLPVPVTTAVLGGTVDVPSPSGRTLRLKVPPTTQNGQRFRLRDQGMPALGKQDDRGSLYVTLDVQVPRTLTADERAHYEALATLEQQSRPTTA